MAGGPHARGGYIGGWSDRRNLGLFCASGAILEDSPILRQRPGLLRMLVCSGAAAFLKSKTCKYMNDQFLHPGINTELNALKHAGANGFTVRPADTPGSLIVTFYSNLYLLTAFVFENEQEWAHDLELLKTVLPDLEEGKTLRDEPAETPALAETVQANAQAGAAAEQEKQPEAETPDLQQEENRDEITFKNSALTDEVENFDQLGVTNYQRSNGAKFCGLVVYRGHTIVGNYAYASQQDREHDIVNMLKLYPLLIEMGHTQPA